MARESREDLLKRLRSAQQRLHEAEETLLALRTGQVDAVVVSGPEADRVYTLKGADEPYRIMVQTMAEGAVTLTSDGLILFSNEQFATLLGAPLERVIGSSIQAFIAAEDVPMVSALLTAGPGTRKIEARLKAASRLVPVQLSANALSQDGLDCVCLIVTDLTEQKRNEDIVAAEKLARSILEQAARPIFVVDSTGKIIRANRAAEQLVDGTVLLRQFDGVISLHAGSEAKDYRFKEILSEVRRGGSITGLQATARTPDGRTVDVLLNAARLTGGDSECLGCVIILSDISDLKRAEEALRESESRLRTLSDNMPQGAMYRYVEDPDGKSRFEFISAGIEQLTGLPAAAIVRDAATAIGLVLPEDVERFAAAIADSREHLSRFEVEVRHRHRTTGEVRWSLLRSMPSRRPDGAIVWDGVQLDITDRKLAERDLSLKEDQLRQAQKMESIGVLAGGIAHDFNNLLTGVIGNANLVLESMRTQTAARSRIEALLRAANRAADLTRQLLAYSGKGRFIVRPVDLSRSVQEMVELLRGSIPANVAIDLDLQDDLPAVEADASQIQQVIMNLVLNGSEAIGDRVGRVVIRTLTRHVDSKAIAHFRVEIPEGAYVCLEVQDTGSGIDEATRSRIFEPFFTTKFTGRGLGLPAVQGIVRAHRGAVVVDSHPGRGSLFTVLLPAAGAAAPAPSEPASEGATEFHGRGTILVVDDEEIVRSVVQAVLERSGYRVLLAQNGAEALKVFERAADKVTAVLLDATMPLMSGEETLERLRAIRQDIPVLLSSGYNQVEVLKRFVGQRPAGYIAKPFSAAALLAEIQALCGSSATSGIGPSPSRAAPRRKARPRR